MIEILALLNDTFTKSVVKQPNKQSDEQPDTTDTPHLKDKDFAAQKNLSAKGLKLLTPNQMLNRLPISLAQSKAAINTEKLKNEIRQLLYSLNRSKKLIKTIYNHLINTK